MKLPRKRSQIVGRFEGRRRGVRAARTGVAVARGQRDRRHDCRAPLLGRGHRLGERERTGRRQHTHRQRRTGSRHFARRGYRRVGDRVQYASRRLAHVLRRSRRVGIQRVGAQCNLHTGSAGRAISRRFKDEFAECCASLSWMGETPYHTNIDLASPLVAGCSKCSWDCVR